MTKPATNDQQCIAGEAPRRELINQIIGIYCELPEDKRPELITHIERTREKNYQQNTELLALFRKMSDAEKEKVLRLIHAMLDGDVETLKAIEAENPAYQGETLQRIIAGIERGEPCRHEMKPIPAELPAVDKLPLLIHNTHLMCWEDCDTALGLLRMGGVEV